MLHNLAIHDITTGAIVNIRSGVRDKKQLHSNRNYRPVSREGDRQASTVLRNSHHQHLSRGTVARVKKGIGM